MSNEIGAIIELIDHFGVFYPDNNSYMAHAIGLWDFFAAENGTTSNTTLKLFQSLLGRRVNIVSKRWVKDSILHGRVQDMTKYLVKGATHYGEWSKEEHYRPFEFQIAGNDWTGITEASLISRYSPDCLHRTDPYQLASTRATHV